MANFIYKALTTDGSLTEGRLDASGRQEALRQLQERGLKPVKLNEGAQTGAAARPRAEKASDQAGLRFGHRHVSQADIENFMRQMSSLLAAGVPLARALQILSKGHEKHAAARQWRQVHDMVIDGTPLADAMSRLPGTFPRVYIAMVRAGETGGFLDVVLSQIADFQAREKDLRSKVTSALIYPAVLAVLTIGVVIFLLTFFIPRFTPLFANLGGALPVLTQIIIGASNVITDYGLIVAAGIGVVIYALTQWLHTDHGRRAWEGLLLRLPVIGPLNARFAMTRFCRMLGTLVHSGVPLIVSLRTARESLGNQILVDAVSGSIERVQQGDALAASLAETPALFSDSVIEMISVAEESGRLDTELMRLADVTEKELDGQLRTAVSLAEPLLLFIMAGFIGTIFIGMVLPIFTIQELIN